MAEETSFCRAAPGGIRVALKVQPRASKNEFAGMLGSELKIRVTAPPVDSAANQAVIEFMAAWLGVPRGTVIIERGHGSAHKILFISGIACDLVAAKIRS